MNFSPETNIAHGITWSRPAQLPFSEHVGCSQDTQRRSSSTYEVTKQPKQPTVSRNHTRKEEASDGCCPSSCLRTEAERLQLLSKSARQFRHLRQHTRYRCEISVRGKLNLRFLRHHLVCHCLSILPCISSATAIRLAFTRSPSPSQPCTCSFQIWRE